MRTYTFRVVIEPDEDSWHAYCPALLKQGGATWGRTKQEALQHIHEVVAMLVTSCPFGYDTCGQPPTSNPQEGSPMTADTAKAVARAFIDAFNNRDAEALADTLNFPHVRLANGRFLRLETRADFLARETRVGPALQAEGWSHTVMESIETVHEGPDKVHLAIEHTRRHADGTVYQRFETLWIVTLQDGHWGIQFRSSYLPTSIDDPVRR